MWEGVAREWPQTVSRRSFGAAETSSSSPPRRPPYCPWGQPPPRRQSHFLETCCLKYGMVVVLVVGKMLKQPLRGKKSRAALESPTLRGASSGQTAGFRVVSEVRSPRAPRSGLGVPLCHSSEAATSPFCSLGCRVGTSGGLWLAGGGDGELVVGTSCACC